MRKRLLIGLASVTLVVTMAPGVATAAGGPRDMVRGTATFEIDDSRAWVNARSDADGSNPSGTYRIDVGDPPLSFSADVVCLHVDDAEAVVGAVVTSSSDVSLVPIGTGLLHFIEDNGPPGAPDASITILDQLEDECATTAPIFPLEEAATGNWIVRDRDS